MMKPWKQEVLRSRMELLLAKDYSPRCCSKVTERDCSKAQLLLSAAGKKLIENLVTD